MGTLNPTIPYLLFTIRLLNFDFFWASAEVCSLLRALLVYFCCQYYICWFVSSEVTWVFFCQIHHLCRSCIVVLCESWCTHYIMTRDDKCPTCGIWQMLHSWLVALEVACLVMAPYKLFHTYLFFCEGCSACFMQIVKIFHHLLRCSISFLHLSNVDIKLFYVNSWLVSTQ